MASKRVCVTGASGFIASWLVKLLLERGYQVRGTVRSLADPSRTNHLRALPGADNGMLELVEADLLAPGSFDSAVQDCDAVFHTASPFFHKNLTDPEAQLIEPAVKGTMNVLESSHKHKVRRVVVTSSTASVAYNRARGSVEVVDENCYSEPEYCKEQKVWYVLSKTLAEQAAWKYAHEKQMDMVTIHPAMVIGSMLQPSLNTSSEIVLNLINGCFCSLLPCIFSFLRFRVLGSRATYSNTVVGWVGVKDTALAHILAYENEKSSGRYLCVEQVLHYSEFTSLLKHLYAEYPVPSRCESEEPPAKTYKVSTKRTQELGLEFQPLEESIKECVESLKANKFI